MFTELILGVHLLSTHIPDHGQNNSNYGVYALTKEGWTAGIYNNSYKKTSVYAGYQFELGPVSLTAGAVTGYEKTLIPVLTPSVKMGPLRFWYALNPKNKTQLIHLSIEHEF